MSSKKTGKGKQGWDKEKAVNIGILVFNIFIWGWFWFGDTVSDLITKNFDVKINDKQISVNLDKATEKIKTTIDHITSNIETNTNDNQETEVVDKVEVKKEEKDDDPFGENDIYGEEEDKY